MTLHFYSPKAYGYVRKAFDTCLPHPKTLAKWHTSVDGKPGFSQTALSAIATRVEAEKQQNKDVVCALMFDEVALRQQVDFNGIDYSGFIDMGTQMDDDSLPLAKEALVFMVTSVNSNWKMPIGYFLIAGLNGEERKNLLLSCLSKLHEIGVQIVSVTHDGQAANQSMLKLLGVFVNEDGSICSSFPHPETKMPVVVFLDPCHMLKLVRNTLGSKGCLWAGSSTVKWDYISSLHKLQEAEGLHTGNKLRANHIAWHKKKMNVKLAAQTLSESVAKSLEFCLNEGLEQFQGCEETVKFIEIFNALFDILNSRNLRSYGWKAPMSSHNYVVYLDFLQKAKLYILSLCESKNGQKLITGCRKTGFVGFLICINSAISLYSTLVQSGQVKFLLMYKFSQDHIELFFGKVRSMFGCNNNPTSRQFSSAFRKLLMHNEIQDVARGNCVPLETIPVLTASSSYKHICNEDMDVPSVSAINVSLEKKNLLEDFCTDHTYSVSTSSYQLEKIIAYIAGFQLCCL